jgi:hypothetical protein
MLTRLLLGVLLVNREGVKRRESGTEKEVWPPGTDDRLDSRVSV